MTQEQIAGNKLIAEFLGWHLDPKRLLKYHSSWDWIIPVCSKCRDVLKAESKKCAHSHYHVMYAEINNGLFKLDLKLLFKALVKFITWYNQQTSSMTDHKPGAEMPIDFQLKEELISKHFPFLTFQERDAWRNNFHSLISESASKEGKGMPDPSSEIESLRAERDQQAIEFADYLLYDFDMVETPDGGLGWQSGNPKIYTSQQLYAIFIKDQEKQKASPSKPTP